MVQKKQRTVIGSAEEKFKALLDKRNEMNNLATSMREERDLLTEEKRKYIAELNKTRDKRNELVAKRKEHIKLRNRYQEKAKALIAEKKKTSSKIYADLPSEVRALKADIKILEMRQQTESLTLKAERELLDEIKKKSKELKRLEGLLTEQSKLNKDVKEIGGSIDELFKKADVEHAEVVKISKDIDKVSEHLENVRDDIGVLARKSDERHEGFLKAREKADSYHLKSQEMREKILSLKKEAGSDMKGERALLKEQNKDVKETFRSDKVEKKREEALEDLKKSGKIILK